jgi:hypothetical protein
MAGKNVHILCRGVVSCYQLVHPELQRQYDFAYETKVYLVLAQPLPPSTVILQV